MSKRLNKRGKLSHGKLNSDHSAHWKCGKSSGGCKGNKQ